MEKMQKPSYSPHSKKDTLKKAVIERHRVHVKARYVFAFQELEHKHFPKAKKIFDKFHVLSHVLSVQLDKVKSQENKEFSSKYSKGQTACY